MAGALGGAFAFLGPFSAALVAFKFRLFTQEQRGRYGSSESALSYRP